MGKDYFSIGENGQVRASVEEPGRDRINPAQLVETPASRHQPAGKLNPLQRHPKHRVKDIHDAFQTGHRANSIRAITSASYPIINQQRHVVEGSVRVRAVCKLWPRSRLETRADGRGHRRQTDTQYHLGNGFKDAESRWRCSPRRSGVTSSPSSVRHRFELILEQAEKIGVQSKHRHARRRWRHRGLRPPANSPAAGHRLARAIDGRREIPKGPSSSRQQRGKMEDRFKPLHFHLGARFPPSASSRVRSPAARIYASKRAAVKAGAARVRTLWSRRRLRTVADQLRVEPEPHRLKKDARHRRCLPLRERV